jgi:hypothetical protein
MEVVEVVEEEVEVLGLKGSRLCCAVAGWGGRLILGSK